MSKRALRAATVQKACIQRVYNWAINGQIGQLIVNCLINASIAS